ncbi:MAG: type I-E CRISPR-associated protein Cse1/CasA [Spirochaetes bacterium]|nr:type I-E CRISPR-associated protein Cse1/CasA [Spirochaetota bacterium]MBN2770113.1 type I-E CRISPR-associated protein Cse1/CasA [Spirochaetota bacterium]
MPQYSLLTEPWIDVVTLKGESVAVGLVDLFKNAHTYDRLDFSMPGFDLAVLRFLVAMVYIVEPPRTYEEWEEMYERGEFTESFVKGLMKYEERLDLFHEKYPFMQNNVLRDDINLTSTTALYKIFPGKTAATHFKHIPHSTDYTVCPKCAVSALLATQTFANSGGVANKENGQSRSYLAGINGASPLFIYLNGHDIYSTIVMNCVSNELISDMSEKSEIANKSYWPNVISKDFDVNVNNIGVVDGYLWQPRNVRFMTAEKETAVCISCGKDLSDSVSISNMDFRSGNYRIKDGLFWSDPMVARIHKEDGTITRAALSGTSRAERAGWRDYASLLFHEKIVKKSKAGEKTSEQFVPAVLQQCSTFGINARINIFSLIVETSSQPQIKKILSGTYEFSNSLLDEYMQKQLRDIVRLSESSQSALYYALKTAYKDETTFSVAEKFWTSLESNFQYLLHEIIYADRDFVPVLEWRKILKKRIRQMFAEESASLLSKSSFIVSLEKGRADLEKYIYFNLTDKEVKESVTKE